MLDAGWNVRSLIAAAPGVEFENTNALCKRKKYARFKFPGTAYMYPEYVLNQAYEETDVFVSLAKLKQHADCGVTLSLKNCFGCVPASIYGDDAGIDEPNESPKQGRLAVVHQAKRQPSKIAPPELHPGTSNTAGVRVSRGGRPHGGAPHPPGNRRRKSIPWRGSVDPGLRPSRRAC
jgi:hypothetical protein